GLPPLNLYARVRFLYAFCTRDRGCSAHPAFPAPSRGGDSSKTRTQCAARSRMYVFVVPALSRDPYAAAVVLRDPVGRLLRNNPGLWLWVPAQGRDECVR